MSNIDLTVLHELGRFKNIRYFDEPHHYFINDRQLISATTFIGKFKPAFETEKIATNYAEKNDLIKEDVIEEWDYKRDTAAFKGTVFHKYAEDYFNNKVYPYTHGERLIKEYGHDILKGKMEVLTKHFHKFYEDSFENLIPIKTEWIVGSEELGICGCVDLLVYNRKSGMLEIYDYKTNKAINTYSRYKKRMKHPIAHLDQCEMTTYSLQLSLYKYIIETYTGLKLGNCYLIWIFEENDSYKLFKCHDYREEVESMIAYAKKTQWI